MQKTLKNNIVQHNPTECTKSLPHVRDALHILGGKWKLPIMFALGFGNKRFTEMLREIKGITAKMLSKELKDLETNELVNRIVHNTRPVTVEYALSDYGMSLRKVLEELNSWGKKHRMKLITQVNKEEAK